MRTLSLALCGLTFGACASPGKADTSPPSDSGDTAAPAPACDGRALADATDLEHALHVLGYAQFPEGETADTLTRVITDDAGWAAIVADLGTDGGLAPDFARDVAFSHAWVDGGCEPAYRYTVLSWDAGGRVRAQGVQEGVNEGCDAYFPTAALIVARGVAGADLGWCLSPAPTAAP